MEIEFELSSDEATTIKAEYLMEGNRFRVRKWLHPTDKAKQGLLAYENGSLSQNKFYGFPGVGQGKLGNLIYIPATGRLEEHTKLTGPSALRDLLSSILKSVTNSSSAYENLKAHIEEFNQKIKTESTPDNRSLSDLEKRINEEIKDWEVEFSLKVDPPQVEDIIKNLVRHTLIDRVLNTVIDQEAYGNGFQRHLIFTLIRMAAEYDAPKPESNKKEFSPKMDLLLFEEPEAFLHPPQQDVLDISLRRLAAQPHRQVIITSHSPHFVSYNTDNLTDLVRLRKVSGKSEVTQISRERLKEIFSISTQLASILGQEPAPPELEAMRYFL